MARIDIIGKLTHLALSTDIGTKSNYVDLCYPQQLPFVVVVVVVFVSVVFSSSRSFIILDYIVQRDAILKLRVAIHIFSIVVNLTPFEFIFEYK